MTVVALLWAGLVLGVSFVATPIKFRARSLTLPVALDVGRATFHALARAEWVLGVVLLMTLFVDGDPGLVVGGGVALVAIILLVQASYLIPRLDIRVAAVIAGTPMAKSKLHLVFAGLEFVKIVALIVVGVGGMR